MIEFIQEQNVFIGEPLTSRKETLHFISDKAEELGYTDDAYAVYEAFQEREKLGATGLLDGFAIPHAKSNVIQKPGVIVVKLKHELEWPSFDKQPIKAVIALLAPVGDAGADHIKMLSRFAVLLMRDSFRNDVSASNDAQQIARLINEGLETS